MSTLNTWPPRNTAAIEPLDTAAFSDASAAFLQYYKDIKISAPKVPLYSCSSVGLFPDKAAEAVMSADVAAETGRSRVAGGAGLAN